MAHEYGRIRILAIAKMLNEGERISISKILSRLEAQYGIYADRKTIYTDLSAIGRFMPIDKKKGVNAGYKKCDADEPAVDAVDVDKEELLRALQYDRNQYEKGYADGKRDAMDELVRCKDCKFCRTFYPVKEIGKKAIQVWYCDLYRCNRKPEEFCSDGERRKGE